MHVEVSKIFAINVIKLTIFCYIFIYNIYIFNNNDNGIYIYEKILTNKFVRCSLDFASNKGGKSLEIPYIFQAEKNFALSHYEMIFL